MVTCYNMRNGYRGHIIQTPEVPPANATYSQAIRAGGFLFVSGQTGVNPGTGLVISDNVEEQARQAIENTAAILRAAGSSLGKVVSVNLYLTDYSSLSLVNQVYCEYFPVPAPAKMSCGVSELYGGAKFEIQVIALA
jgi:2-iminobutanoate/2-iminopropanoate deaminase